MIPLCACPIGASYATANVKLQEGRGRAQEGHFNLAEIFCSNALLHMHLWMVKPVTHLL